MENFARDVPELKGHWTKMCEPDEETRRRQSGVAQAKSHPVQGICGARRGLGGLGGGWFDKLNQRVMNVAKCDKEAEPSESMSNPSGYVATSSSMHSYKASAICSPGSLASPCSSAFQQALVQQLLATGASTLRWRPWNRHPRTERVKTIKGNNAGMGSHMALLHGAHWSGGEKHAAQQTTKDLPTIHKMYRQIQSALPLRTWGGITTGVFTFGRSDQCQWLPSTSTNMKAVQCPSHLYFYCQSSVQIKGAMLVPITQGTLVLIKMVYPS